MPRPGATTTISPPPRPPITIPVTVVITTMSDTTMTTIMVAVRTVTDAARRVVRMFESVGQSR